MFLIQFGITCHVITLYASYPRLFPDLVLRYPTGDQSAINPLQNTEGPKALAAGDLNRDGKADIVTGNLDGSISVLLGSTNGLQNQILVPATGILSNCSIRSIVVADFNRDGKNDVAVADIARGGIVLLAGSGTGTLSPYERIAIGPARALAVADFDRDGNPDLLVGASPSSDEERKVPYTEAGTNRFLCVMLGKGDGSFSDPKYLVPPGGAAYFYKVEAADFNRDGYDDIAALDFSNWFVSTNNTATQKRILIYYNDKKGGFDSSSPQRILSCTGQGPRSFCVAFVDEKMTSSSDPPPNGTLDIVVANRDSSTVEVFTNRGNGEFDNPKTLRIGGSARDVAAGDLDGDGYTDLVVVDRDKNLISVLQGKPDVTFTEVLAELPTGVSPRQIVLADVTGDGILDAAVNNRISEDVSIFLGKRGLVGFLMPGTYYPAGFSPVSVVSGDFNEDGYPDAATANLRSHDVRIRLNLTDGSFGEEIIYPVNYEPVCLAMGDLNRDGHIDLVVSSIGYGSQGAGKQQGSLLTTMLGKGDGTFVILKSERPDEVGPSFHSYWLRLGDLSGDGVLDAAVGGANGALIVQKGVGDGTFEPGLWISSIADGRPLGLALGDFDQDGRLDIATSRGKIIFNDGHFFSGTDPVTNKIVMSGRTSTFISANDTGFFQAWAVEAEDLDTDGKLDLMVALTFRRPDPIGIFYGKGDGSFTEPTIYEGPDVGAVALAGKDMDNDSIKDLIIGNRCAATVIIMKGLGNRKFEIREIIRSYSVEGLCVSDLNKDGKYDILGAGIGLWPIINGSTTEWIEPRTSQWGNTPERWGLYINEVMSLNQVYYQEKDGSSPDWVEIYNHNTFTQSLVGWSLSQISMDGYVEKWNFPDTNSIAPRQRLIVICKKKSVSTYGLCAPFELSAEGETIVLKRPDGIVEDQVSFPALPPDVSYARYLDGARFFAFNPSPTMGTPNRTPGNLRPVAARKDPYVGPGGSSLALTGRFFDDVAITYAALNYRISGSKTPFIELPLNDDGKNGDKQSGDGYYGIMMPPLPPGTQIEYYLRAVDVDGEVATSPENTDDTNALHHIVMPQTGSLIRLNELMADNRTGFQDESGERHDWIELLNCGTNSMNLSGLVLTKDYYNRNSGWHFPSNTWLNPNEYLVLFCDENPGKGPLHLNFRLLKEGDRVFLVKKDDWTVIDSLSYGPLPMETSFGILRHGYEAQMLPWPTPGSVNEGFIKSALSAQAFGSISVRLMPTDISDLKIFGLRWMGDPQLLTFVEWSEDGIHWQQADFPPQHLGEGLYQWLELFATRPQRFFRVSHY